MTLPQKYWIAHTAHSCHQSNPDASSTHNFGTAAVGTPKAVGKTGTRNFGLFHLVGVQHQSNRLIEPLFGIVAGYSKALELGPGVIKTTFANEPPGAFRAEKCGQEEWYGPDPLEHVRQTPAYGQHYSARGLPHCESTVMEARTTPAARNRPKPQHMLTKLVK